MFHLFAKDRPPPNLAMRRSQRSETSKFEGGRKAAEP